MNSHHEHNQSDEPGFWRSRTGVAFIIIGSVAGYFLVTEHWAHFMGASGIQIISATLMDEWREVANC
ncbi:DUF2933 domain-containing protein [Aeromonas taiwanensis]